MRYKTPTIDNKPHWVPIVAKNKDYLIGYLTSLQLFTDIISDILESNNINIDLRAIDLCLDSSRFNDIMENDKREGDCSETELLDYYKQMIKNKISLIEDDHPENDTEFFLEVECPCEFGIYIFKEETDIPDKTLTCSNCGRTIIDYTEHFDTEYEFDGTRKEINLGGNDEID